MWAKWRYEKISRYFLRLISNSMQMQFCVQLVGEFSFSFFFVFLFFFLLLLYNFRTINVNLNVFLLYRIVISSTRIITFDWSRWTISERFSKRRRIFLCYSSLRASRSSRSFRYNSIICSWNFEENNNERYNKSSIQVEL